MGAFLDTINQIPYLQRGVVQKNEKPSGDNRPSISRDLITETPIPPGMLLVDDDRLGCRDGTRVASGCAGVVQDLLMGLRMPLVIAGDIRCENAARRKGPKGFLGYPRPVPRGHQRDWFDNDRGGVHRSRRKTACRWRRVQCLECSGTRPAYSRLIGPLAIDVLAAVRIRGFPSGSFMTSRATNRDCGINPKKSAASSSFVLRRNPGEALGP